MEQHIPVNLKKTKLMVCQVKLIKVMGNIFGQTSEIIKVNGNWIKCMERVSSLGLMEKVMWVLVNKQIGEYINDKKEGYGEF